MPGAQRPRRARGEASAARRRPLLLLSTATLVLATAGAVGWWLDDSGPEPSDEAFCERLAATADLDEVLLGDATAIAEGADRLRAAVEVAPPTVAEDATVLADAVDRLAAGAQAEALDPQAGIDAALVELQPQRERISAAAQAVGAWASTTCGLDLDGTRPVAGPTAPTPDAPVAAPEEAATPS